MAYTLGGKIYKTKKAVTAECQRLKQYVGLEYLPGTYEYRFLSDLITQGHHNPHWHGFKQVVKYFVGCDAHGRTCLMIERPSGSTLGFSFGGCVRGLGKSAKARKDINLNAKRAAAYRVAVGPQIDLFRRSAIPVCEQCYSTRGLQVDHEAPLFKDLIAGFEKTRDVPTQFAGVKSKYGNYRFRCKAYAADWAAYHQAHATLRMLCAKCNLSRKKS